MFTLEEVKKATGGRQISNTDSTVFATSIEVKGVSTDTRTIKPGEIFIALQGENFDGNRFLGKAHCSNRFSRKDFYKDHDRGCPQDRT